MSRYIDVDALKKDVARLHVLNDEAEIRRAYEYNPHVTSMELEETLVSVFDAIDEAPSIAIVFCKECKHRPIKEDANEANYGFNVIAPNEDERCPCLVEDGWYSWIPKDNFFCGYGEREGE